MARTGGLGRVYPPQPIPVAAPDTVEVAVRFEYRRCEFRTAEWEALREDGYRTIAVNGEGIALLRRPFQQEKSADDADDEE